MGNDTLIDSNGLIKNENIETTEEFLTEAFSYQNTININPFRDLRVNLFRLKLGVDGKFIVPEDNVPEKKVLHGEVQLRRCEDIVDRKEDCLERRLSGDSDLTDTDSDNDGEKCILGLSYTSVNKKSQPSLKKDNRKNSRSLQKKRFKCDSCEKWFLTNSELKRHNRIHTGELPYKCPMCEKRFRNQSNMVLHLKLHTRENIVNCDICNKEFARKATLQRHYRLFHEACSIEILKPYACPECQKRFRERNECKEHVDRVHKKIFKHVCDECGKGFRDRNKLAFHMRIHAGVKPFDCSTCSRKFRTKELLTAHQRTHTNEYKYRCGVCGQGCLGPGPLMVHLKTHTGEKPLQCPKCPKKYLHKCLYYSHLKTHSK